VKKRAYNPWVTAVALAVFFGLLLAGHMFPAAATPLRGLAVLWFLTFGIVRFAFDWERAKARRLSEVNSRRAT
jgi:hypothetical protein